MGAEPTAPPWGEKAMLLLDRLFRRIVVRGSLDVTWPDGRTIRYGNGEMPRAAIAVRSLASPS